MSAYDGIPARERAEDRATARSAERDTASGAAPHFLPCGTDVGRLGAGGRRDVLRLDAPFVTELGESIAGAELSYRTWGRLSNAADNAVVVCHALTGSSELESWWPALLGPGRALDPDRDFVIAIDALGSVHGSTGPASAAPDGEPWGRRFPRLSVRDLVRSQRLVLDALGVRGVALVIGGSLGGMQALEWALLDARVRAAAVVAAPARHEAWAMGWSAAQRAALAADPAWADAPFEARAGLAAARAIAMLSYRAPAGFDERFGRRRGDRHDFAVADWLAHHGEALVRRFDPLSYAVLLDAMDSHDIGRSRGGVGPALASLRVPLLAVAIESDQLYPVDEVEQLVQGAPLAEQDQLRSPHGHDAFLIDQRVVESIVRRFRERLQRRERERVSPPQALCDPATAGAPAFDEDDDDALVRRVRTSGLNRTNARAGSRATAAAGAEALARAVRAHDACARFGEWPAYRSAGGVA